MPEKKQETQTSKDKKKKRKKFDTIPTNDFITENSRFKFGHICDKCALKHKCFKWGSSIILQCLDFNAKSAKPTYKKR